ncbi:hypothetical protein ACFQ2B_02695 [Streptomyces stramineus]
MTDAVIDHFTVRWTLAAPRLRADASALLDALLADVLAEALAATVTPDEQVALASVPVPPVSVRAGCTEEAASTWARQVASAVEGQLAAGGPGVVRYPSRSAALLDIASRACAGDTAPLWAWRRLGLWPDAAADNGTVADGVTAALAYQATAIAPVFAGVARRGTLRDLVSLLGPARLEHLAAAAWQAHGGLPEETLTAAAPTAPPWPGPRRPPPPPNTRAPRGTTGSTARPSPGSPPHCRSGHRSARKPAPPPMRAAAPPSSPWPSSMRIRDASPPTAPPSCASPSARSTRRSPERRVRRTGRPPRRHPGGHHHLPGPARPGRPRSRCPARHRPAADAHGSPDRAARHDSRHGPGDHRERRAAPLPPPGHPLTSRAGPGRGLPPELYEADIRWTMHLLGTELLRRSAPRLRAPAPDDPALLAFCGLPPTALPPRPPDGAGPDLLRRASARPADRTVRALRRRLTGRVPARLSQSALLARVLHRRGEITACPGWLELRLDLDGVDVDLRAAGLDLDPGWLPPSAAS